jgi:transposase-like protein
MPAVRKYPDELRARAVRLVLEAQEQEPEASMNRLVVRVGGRVGVKPDTLRGWVIQKQVDEGHRPGTTSDDKAKIKQLEHENAELKRANEILLAASSFFARELDPRLPW